MIAFPNALRSTQWLVAAALVVSLAACTASTAPPSIAPQSGATAVNPTARPQGTPQLSATPEPPSVGKTGDTLEQGNWKMRLTKVEALSAEQATLANDGTPPAGALYVFYITVENTATRPGGLSLSDFQLDLSGDQYFKPSNCCAAYATQHGGSALPTLRAFQPRERINLLLFFNRPAGSNAETFRYTDGKGLRWTVAS